MSQLVSCTLPPTWDLRVRSAPWQASPARERSQAVAEVWRQLHAAKNNDHVVVMTAGIEATAAALHARGPGVQIWDPLVPRSAGLTRLANASWRRLAKFWVIRSGDADTLVRLGVPASRIEFLPFPVTQPLTRGLDHGYVYSAGSAHRDWPTLFTATLSLGIRLKVAAALPRHPSPLIEILGPQSPAAGRALMSKATLVALALEDTHLPSGPLIALDALASGIPVVASNVNGNRDYVIHGETGFLVPPADPVFFADAIKQLLADAGLRANMSEGALALAANLTIDRLLPRLAQTS